ncbi:DMT family transporter [Verminephrobacter eiseniae]|uniref:DMT family transporter n=1 Tax=Verminephrobacter eiseniae TaxID=364317 RepID=UPI0010E2D9C4|nr:DMT family transporter [Verminephrobacter eiseniae]KAB7619463.1 DMT family transporter [Verminephrobacter sp. Larva24]MCW5234366.1 DMT family transporter [Verminephrobacter eiseniae]MCW5294058.1 DMT family transporter [Verminephrobacter eiseniae]MCW8183204.1 DMT family transporter [Verminephrobacter eiseniae]MCW8222145.1 DMT family transporter [Verminephrobacter eiseniae]
MRPERFGLLALLVVTVIWGTTFPAMKLLSQWLDALQIIWLRFAIALAVLAPLWRGMLRHERRWGCALGLLLFLAFWLQIEGLARTSSNRNAFVTGLNVLVVPLIAMALWGRRYGWRLWAACAVACAGMALMFHENEPWNLGDTLTLASTVLYALYILALEECASRNGAQPARASRMAAAQATVIALAATLLLLARGGGMGWLASLARLPPDAWIALSYLGLLASVLVVTLQAWGQQRVDAMRSAIVFGLEPVFAALTAWVLLGEQLGWAGCSGAALIVGALVFSQITPPARAVAAQP